MCRIVHFGVFAAKKCVELGKQINALKSLISKKTDEAREQMRPLNELYTWDIPIALIEKTVPRLDFDPYLTTQRLDDLKRIFGWDDSFTDGKSILFSQSGVINGNPFVFGEYLRMVWSTKTYTGYKTISWRESVTDGNGRRRTVTRTQTLSAMRQQALSKILKRQAPNLRQRRSPQPKFFPLAHWPVKRRGGVCHKYSKVVCPARPKRIFRRPRRRFRLYADVQPRV